MSRAVFQCFCDKHLRMWLLDHDWWREMGVESLDGWAETPDGPDGFDCDTEGCGLEATIEVYYKKEAEG